MKKMMFVVAILVASLSVNAMSPDRKLEYPEAQCFFENVDGHGHRRPWANGNSKRERLTLDFDGRKQFIESVRSSNDDEHINNFKVRVPINPELNVRTEFELKNPNNHSDSYIFNPVTIKNEITGHPYVHRKANEICQSCGYQKNNQCNWGLLNKLINNYSSNIGYFATNVLRILKLSKKPLAIDEPNRINRVANQCVVNTAIEIAAMILTTERARDEYSLLISYIEFYKLKHTDVSNQGKMLLDMFNKSNPTLRFPKAPGGASLIQGMQPNDIYDEFMGMLPYSPYYLKLQQLPKFMHDVLADLFYEEKLEKIKAISENRTLDKTVKFKKLVDASKNFFKFQMKKVINLWKAIANNSEEISEPEVDSVDPYVDQFDEYDENPLNPTMPGHHDHLFRSKSWAWSDD